MNRRILWVVLAASLLLMLPEIHHRVSNEEKNKAVLPAADFSEAPSAAADSIPSAGELEQEGFSAIILDEAALMPTPGGSDTGRSLKPFANRELQIIPRLRSLSCDKNSIARLDTFIREYTVNYLLIYPGPPETVSSSVVPRDKGDSVNALEDLITRHRLTVFVMENKEQNGYMAVSGLDTLIRGIHYNINRAFSIHSSLLVHAGPSESVPVWLRAAVERNVRLVSVDDPASFGAVNELNALLSRKGLSTRYKLSPLDTGIHGSLTKIPVYINLAAALLLYLNCLFKGHMRKKLLIPAFAGLCCAFSLAVFLWGDTGTAFIASLIYPSLSSALLLRYLERQETEGHSLVKRLSISLIILVSVNLAGAATVIAGMADIRYTMHLINYNLVIPSYILPLFAFLINFTVCGSAHYDMSGYISRLWESFIRGHDRKALLKGSLYLLFLTAAILVYAGRSGNTGWLRASAPELALRRFLELTLFVRPRTKEFLIGYPGLFIFVFIYYKNPKSLVLPVTGVLSSIAGISVVNSFCHGFTPASVSLVRSAEGLGLGVLTGSVSLLLLWLTKKILCRNKGKPHQPV